MRIVLGILAAVLLHAGFLLFGGLIVGTEEEARTATREVELVSADDSPEKEKDPEKKEEVAEEPKEDLEAPAEEVPDAAEVVRSLEMPVAAAAPALDAASLGAIEQALSGQGGAAGFGDALTFASGGRIGGTGKAGALDEKLDSAFNLTEIDQKPRAVFQAEPRYPAELRGKKVAGVVSVFFVVEPTGKVSRPKVERSTHPAFEKPALDAVKQWKFEPAIKGGQRVGCKMRVPIRFQPS